jgi:hypothetical protein
METLVESVWLPKSKILKTKLKGLIKMEDAIRWQKELDEVSLLIDRPFKFLFDNYGYEPASLDVHKAWREFAPKLLGRHGLIQSLLPEEAKIKVKNERIESKPICFGMALVHHDEFKMKNIEQSYGNTNQRYGSDNVLALNWISRLTE